MIIQKKEEENPSQKVGETTSPHKEKGEKECKKKIMDIATSDSKRKREKLIEALEEYKDSIVKDTKAEAKLKAEKKQKKTIRKNARKAILPNACMLIFAVFALYVLILEPNPMSALAITVPQMVYAITEMRDKENKGLRVCFESICMVIALCDIMLGMIYQYNLLAGITSPYADTIKTVCIILSPIGVIRSTAVLIFSIITGCLKREQKGGNNKDTKTKNETTDAK